MLNRGKYLSDRDRRFFASITNEFMDDVVENVVLIYKLSIESTKVNIYGEVSQATGKVYHYPAELTALIERSEMNSSDEGFGVDRNQVHVFKFFRDELKRLNVFPETGDLIYFNEKYFEIGNVVEEQLLGGQQEKSWSLICNTHYISLSNIQLVQQIK
jgi:hypothetical protein